MAFSYYLHLKDTDIKISDDPVYDASLNTKTDVLGICTEESRVLLLNINKPDTSQELPSVQFNMDSITKIVWMNNYEIAIVGSCEFLKIFSIMNLSEDSFQIHTGSISTLKRYDGLLYSGSSDARVNVFDPYNKSRVLSLEHTFNRKKHPIVDITINDRYLYSSTPYDGLIWVWDLRNPNRKLNVLKTGFCQQSLVHADGNIYSISDAGLLKISEDLKQSEFVWKNTGSDSYNKGRVNYLERYESAIWTSKDSVHINSSYGTVYGYKYEYKGILGFEVIDTNKFLSFYRSGKIAITEIFKEPYE